MRIKTKPSTARCTEQMYTSYLLSDPHYTSCTRLSDVMETVSHDSINRFLERERYEPKDLFEEEKAKIELVGGTLSVDDSVLDKPYSDPSKAAFIDNFWSGKHKKTVRGINLITLFYTDINGISIPVNYRLCKKSEGKTKNDYFHDMLLEVLSWGLSPCWVTGDSWYSSLANLKFIRKLKLNFMFAIESNRRISIERGKYIQAQKFEGWSDNGNVVYLKDYGLVKMFRQLYKNVYRYYVMGMANIDDVDGLGESDFKKVHSAHWSIEQYHRAIKQVCNIERFQVRQENAIKTHIFCAIKGFVTLEFMRFEKIITHWYEIKRDLFMGVIKEYILKVASKNQFVVNA